MEEEVLLPLHNLEHTHMYVVFESCILDIEDEMSTEFLFCTGVKIEDVVWGAFNPINFHQLVTNILSTKKEKKKKTGKNNTSRLKESHKVK